MKRPRRVNDAQVTRLLDAMRRDVNYRSALARRLIEREGFNPNAKKDSQAYQDYQRRYKSTMRRFQRYITEATEKRSFAHAPVRYQREVRREARHVPPPPLPRAYPPSALPTPRYEREPGEDEDEDEDEGPFELREPVYDARRDLSEYDLPTLEQTIRAYYDGDIDEAAEGLNLSERAKDVFDVATEGEGADVEGMRGAGELQDAIADFLVSVPDADLGDIRAFHDLLMDRPDWQIGMILEDMASGATTFADWMDAYSADDYDIDDVEDSEYWELWRAAYARSKA